MPCALTQSYTLDCRDSSGGVLEVYFIEQDNVSAVTVTAGVVTAITKVATKVFRRYKLVAFTGEMEDTMAVNVENGTISLKQMIKFPINKMTASVKNELLLLGQNRLLAVVKDNNGKGWLLGQEFGLNLTSAAGKTGKALGDRNGIELEFSGESKSFAPEVDAATMLTLLT